VNKKNTGVQEFRSSGVQEFRSRKLLPLFVEPFFNLLSLNNQENKR